MKRVLGFDPGTRLCGYALLDVPPLGRACLVACGRVSSELERIEETIRRHAPELVAVESVVVQRIQAAKQLVAVSDMAGAIRGIASALGIPTVAIPAAEWRTRLGLGRTPSDAAVKRVVRMCVARLPLVTSSHERDAMGLAFAAGLGAAAGVP